MTPPPENGLTVADPTDTREFYELMQAYRFAPIKDQLAVIAAYNAVRAQIRAWLAAQEREEWRPIETAPRDGTSILVLEHGCAIQAHWGADFHPTWVHDRNVGFADLATHWRPLPAPLNTREGER